MKMTKAAIVTSRLLSDRFARDSGLAAIGMTFGSGLTE
jgi:hypothetical protein